MKKFVMAAGSATGALILAVAGATSASAHDGTVSGPNACGTSRLQSCGWGGTTGGHQWVSACDGVADGYGYRVDYELANGATGSVSDSNGSAAGCGNRKVGTATNTVVWLQPCNSTLGICGPIVRA
ncbi:hypothetical protein ACIQVO_27705 [Streptomyces sp. NPDC101062]|uniref:hypothetical protein n=1 Tax=unclassified Streptomyces TaxID=2593676 RepID=UPI0037F89704